MLNDSRIKDLSGKRFGRLVAILPTEERINRNIVWLCECDCGKQLGIKSCHLINGRTQSCGCLRNDSAKTTHTNHGKAHSKINHVWASMKQRCLNPNNKGFPNYGGRGITVCQEWQDSFQAFYDYVSRLPHFGEDGYSLDRINNDGNYEPGNVKWSTRAEQNRNRRCFRKKVKDYIQ